MNKNHFFFFLFMLGMIGTNAWALDQKEGVYQIGTAEDLVAFSQLVNGGEGTANAVLTADIDLGGIDWTPIGAGSSYWYATGKDNVTNAGFAGVFDGQGHIISNFHNINESSGAVGLFGVVTGMVKNLGVTKVTFSESVPERAGCIAGSVTATAESVGLVMNCYVLDSTLPPACVCGSVAGAVYGGVVQDCFAANNVLDGVFDRFGGIAGDTRSDGGWMGTVTNCYTDFVRIVSSQAGITNGGEGNVSAERFQSGEIAYLLNGSQNDNPVWYQTLGEDPYPVLDAGHYKVIMNEDGTYDNSTGIEEIHNSQFTIHSSDAIYDLMGRQMVNGKLPKGLYIIKGKKVLVK